MHRPSNDPRTVSVRQPNRRRLRGRSRSGTGRFDLDCLCASRPSARIAVISWPRTRLSPCTARRPYEGFYDFWPKPKDNPFTDVLSRVPKYVASHTLTEPLPWENSTLLDGDVPDAVAKLKAQTDKDIGVLGSGDLVQTLIRHDLVDKYLLLIHPLVLYHRLGLLVACESPALDIPPHTLRDRRSAGSTACGRLEDIALPSARYRVSSPLS